MACITAWCCSWASPVPARLAFFGLSPMSSALSVINVNLVLSGKLLEMTAKQRSLQLQETFNLVVDKAQSPVVLDNLEILFDKDLMQDPLRLLQGISRNRAVLASWNGTSVGGRLLYAEAGHPEYRSYGSVDALIVCMDGTATIDSVTNNRGVEQT